MTDEYTITRYNQPGASIAVSLPDGPLPLYSFRDFYAFENHVKTARQRRGLDMVPQWYEFPVFYFSNPRAMLLSGEALRRPRHGEWLDFELEVAAIIGTGGKNISLSEAETHILGLTLLNDWSLRDIQREEVKVGLGPAKGKDFATSLGPKVVPMAALAKRKTDNGYDIEMTAEINGIQVSKGNLGDIHYSLSELVAQASRDAELFPGDIIGSGTVGTGCILELGPDHVANALGRENGWLQAGDKVVLKATAIGELATTIAPPEGER